MELNGGAEQGRIGSGNEFDRLKDGTGIRIADVLKADSGNGSGLYMETEAALAGTLTALVTAVFRTGRAMRSG